MNEPTHENAEMKVGNGLIGATLTLLAVLFVSINLLSSAWFSSSRLDLTEDRLYTLSSSTKTLLASVNEPVTFRLYISSELAQHVPHMGIYANRVRDLLREYESASDGMVRVEILDPAPFTDIEDRAVAVGLQGVPVVSGGDKLYFGVVGTNTTDDIETIPFMQVDREAFLEYDISRMLYSLSTTKPTVVGILSSLPIDGTMRMTATGQQEPVPPYVVRTQIGELFETRFLGRQVNEVPDDINVLLVVHPKQMTPRTLFAVDQYLLEGGKSMIFVDPFAEAEGMEGQMLGATIDGSSLSELFKTWGLQFDPTKVVIDRISARKVMPEGSNRLVEYLPWLELRGPNVRSGSPITSGIESVALASCGFLTVKDGAPIEMQPLLITSPGSSLIDHKKVQGFRNPLKLLREFKPGNTQYVVAGRISGSVQTSFPDGPPKPPEDDEMPKPPPPWSKHALKKSVKPLDIIVVADADILVDRFWVIMRDYLGRQVPIPTANNGPFVLNAIEALAGSNTLMALRGRGTASRPFVVVKEIQRAADQKFQDKERELRETLSNTEADLRKVRLSNTEGAAAVISEKDRRSMQRYQREILRIRAELRTVRRSLTENFEALEVRLWFLNIALVPLLITTFAIALAVWRAMRRRNRAHETAAG